MRVYLAPCPIQAIFKALAAFKVQPHLMSMNSHTATLNSLNYSLRFVGIIDVNCFNPLTAAIRGSGYKFFVTLYHEPAARLEHYLENGTVIRRAG